ncbi:hypothetical protein [Nocardia carnea]|uniref:hypothetical protein n=1 Tax=Nocardia carnea TaxID=37328 RepID=UPI0024540317|nr:hypothetical protein [Nocardia carnea]
MNAAHGLDVDGEMFSRWMKEAGVIAVLVRPDFYVLGSASEPGEVSGLLASLGPALSLTR